MFGVFGGMGGVGAAGPMGQIDGPRAAELQKALGTYDARLGAAVELLAQGLGRDPAAERRGFEGLVRHFTPRGEGAGGAHGGDLGGGDLGGGDLMSRLTSIVGQSLPSAVELVAVFREGKLAAHGFLSQGGVGASLPAAVRALVEASLKALLAQSRGGEAEALAGVFTRLFPDLQRLAQFSPTAQAVVAGVGLGSRGLVLKMYFNTRLYPEAGHRERVVDALAFAGIEARRAAQACEQLIGDDDLARFGGIGIDFEGRPVAERRAKIYARLPVAHLDAKVTALAKVFELEPRGLLDLVAATLPTDVIADDVEVGLGLGADRTTLKVTPFFPPKAPIPLVVETCGRVFAAMGCDSSLVAQLARTLDGGGVITTCPIHGLGFEIPTGPGGKINVYLQATL